MEEHPFRKYIDWHKDPTGPVIFISLLDEKLNGEKEINEWIKELIKPHLSDDLKFKYLNLNKSSDIWKDLQDLDVNGICRHIGFDSTDQGSKNVKQTGTIWTVDVNGLHRCN